MSTDPSQNPDSTDNAIYQAPRSNVITADQQPYQPEIFTFEGRIGRLRYVVYSLIYSLSVWLIVLLANLMSKTLGAIALSLLLITLVPVWRRLNDLNLPGILSLITLIPIVNMFFSLYLTCAPGTLGTNKYGPPPNQNPPGIKIIGIASLSLIPIGLIGILAASAIPLYQNYIIRSRWVTNFAAVTPIKTAVAKCLQTHHGKTTSCDSWSKIGLLNKTIGSPDAQETITADHQPFHMKYGSALIVKETAALMITGDKVSGKTQGQYPSPCVVVLTPVMNAGEAIRWAVDYDVDTEEKFPNCAKRYIGIYKTDAKGMETEQSRKESQ